MHGAAENSVCWLRTVLQFKPKGSFVSLCLLDMRGTGSGKAMASTAFLTVTGPVGFLDLTSRETHILLHNFAAFFAYLTALDIHSAV